MMMMMVVVVVVVVVVAPHLRPFTEFVVCTLNLSAATIQKLVFSPCCKFCPFEGLAHVAGATLFNAPTKRDDRQMHGLYRVAI
jgi:hypothetical protein